MISSLGARLTLDKGSSWRNLGCLLTALGLCLLLIAGLQSFAAANAVREISQREVVATVTPSRTSPAAANSAIPVAEGESDNPEAPAAPSLDVAPEEPPAKLRSLPHPGRVPGYTAPPQSRLVIPTLAIEAPIVEVPLVNRTWDVSGLTHDVGHLEGTSNPGDKGNTVISGHVTLRRGGGPFLRLETLQSGDIAVVYTGSQAYTYRVVDKRYVGPDDVSVTYSSLDPILTLLTCTKWDSENRTYEERVAVIAELVDEEMP